jgi:hypothetical protein
MTLKTVATYAKVFFIYLGIIGEAVKKSLVKGGIQIMLQ